MVLARMEDYTWDEPLCLIDNTPDMGLQVNQTTAEKLTKVKVPVSVVVVAGLYRTGKSYLMNLLAGKSG